MDQTSGILAAHSLVGSIMDIVFAPFWLTIGVLFNAFLSPMLFFLYPYVGFLLLFGDRSHALRNEMVEAPNSFYGKLIHWSHNGLYEAQAILKTIGFEPSGVEATEIPAWRLAFVYGLQWVLLLPNTIVIFGSLALIIFHKQVSEVMQYCFDEAHQAFDFLLSFSVPPQIKKLLAGKK